MGNTLFGRNCHVSSIRILDHKPSLELTSSDSFRCSNPQLRVDELVHQLSTVKVRLMVVHSNTLETALSAARIVGLPSDRIVLIDEPQCEPTAAGPSSDRWSIPRLVDLGERAIRSYSDGFVPPCGTVEGSSKVAMLCWSSGTTGPPKVS